MELKEIIKGYAIFDAGLEVGHIDFHEAEGVLKITHTEVSENHSGKGLAKQLVLSAVGYAQKKHLKVKPLCSAAAHILKGEEFKDVLE